VTMRMPAADSVTIQSCGVFRARNMAEPSC
jgi:hypothetical protein